MPGGQFSVRTPQSCTIGLWGIAKLEIQTLSLPSMTAAQGPGRPPPVNGEPGYWVPSGRSRVTLPSLPFCWDMCFVMYSVADSNPSIFRRAAMSTRWAMPSSPSPNRLVTHTLPWLSMLRPLLAIPVLKFSALLGSAAGKRVTLSLAFETQIRSCWSMARWNGPRNDLHGSALSPSQTIRPLVQSPLGMWMSWRFETPRAHTSPLGVAMMPCISPSCPLKVIPSGGVSGLPFLSNTAIDLPPYVENQALSLASTAAPNEAPCMPPPKNPVVIGDSGLPFGLNLVALPCHSESCPCQPTVKLLPTQRFPSLSNIAPPPAR